LCTQHIHALFLNIQTWGSIQKRFCNGSDACLQAVPLERGEPTVALLFLWEAAHGTTFPSRAADLRGRIATFSACLSRAVAQDHHLQPWVHHRKMHFRLAPGLPALEYTRWTVAISPAVGEPFFATWKSYLRQVAEQHSAICTHPQQPPGTPPPKRQRRNPRRCPGVKRCRSSIADGQIIPRLTKRARVDPIPLPLPPSVPHRRCAPMHSCGRASTSGADT
jgi:hypothetical protein